MSEEYTEAFEKYWAENDPELVAYTDFFWIAEEIKRCAFNAWCAGRKPLEDEYDDATGLI